MTGSVVALRCRVLMNHNLATIQYGRTCYTIIFVINQNVRCFLRENCENKGYRVIVCKNPGPDSQPIRVIIFSPRASPEVFYDVVAHGKQDYFRVP